MSFDFAVEFPNVGDDYVVEELPTIQSLQVESTQFNSYVSAGVASDGRLLFENFNIGGSTDAISAGSNHIGGVQFLNCEILQPEAELGGGAVFWNCLTDAAVLTGPSYYWFFTGLVTTYILAEPGSPGAHLRGPLCQDCFLIFFGLDSSVFISEYSGGGNGGIGIFDCLTDGLWLGPGVIAQSTGPVYGSGNTGYGIRADANAVLAYGSSVKPTITASVNDTIIGGTATAYAGVPSFNTTNGAGIVVDV
jgi:hypothetical protein